MKPPLISVLLPVYNCEQYIHESVQSILDQTEADFELLIVDDASTDTTLSIVRAFGDPRIKVIQKPENSGYTKSLNLAINLARGDYLARMDGDDISLPSRFAKQVNLMSSNPDVAVCGTAFRIIGTEVVVRTPEAHDEITVGMLLHSCVAHPTAMIRSSFLRQHALNYDVAKEPAEDYDLWVRISRLGKLHNLQEVLLHYRNHDSQVSVTRKERQQAMALAISVDLIQHVGYRFSAEEERVYRKALSEEDGFDISDIYTYLSVKKSLHRSNRSCFKPDAFSDFLNFLEAKMVSSYFLRCKVFSPRVFLQYLSVRRYLHQGIGMWSTVKLLVKSLVFYRTGRASELNRA